jgi:hypothetical protein
MVTDWSGLVYQCDHVLLEHQLVALDVNTPMDMRAPGGATGMFALECALDELAGKLGMDPLALRLKNYSEEDQSQGKPYSSKELRECYRQGADHFGWARRPAAPRSMQTGRHLVGWGMATGCWFVQQKPARARAVLTADGKLTVSSATADLGTGTYTIMAQVAAQTLGLPLEQVTAELGDSDLPLAPNAGGSETAASIGSAVQRVCEKLKATLLQFSRSLDNSPFTRAGLDEVTFAGGQIKLNSDPTQALYLTDIMRRRQLNRLKETTTSLPKILKQRKYAFNSHSAVFVEVKVDEDLGTVQVSRVVSAVAAGRILNPKTARSQILGGVVWGMGMALQEDSVLDPQFGRFINHDLAGYHVPVHADMPEELKTPLGLLTTGILVLQDFLIVPMVLNFMGGEDFKTSQLVAGAVATMVILLFLREVALKKSIALPFPDLLQKDHELQVFTGLVICFGFAWLTSLLHLSAAMGALMAGILIANSTSTRWLEHSLVPFRIFFLALFFLSIGLQINVRFLWTHTGLILTIVLIILLINSVINALVFRLLKESWRNSISAGAMLSQIGEFSLVLCLVAREQQLVDDYWYQLTLAVVSVTMLFTAVWISVIRAFIFRQPSNLRRLSFFMTGVRDNK